MNSLFHSDIVSIAERAAKNVIENIEPLLDKVMAKHLRHYTDRVLTKEQLAVFLDCSTDAIDKLCQRHGMPYHQKGKRRYFSKNEIIDYFLESNRECES